MTREEFKEEFKERFQYYWHSHSWIRRTPRLAFQIATFPICWPCHIFKWHRCLPRFSQGCVIDRGENTSAEKLNKICFRRRIRATNNRKRDISLSGKRTKFGKKEMPLDMQLLSPLFSKVPIEVRIMIYEAVLCGTRSVHVRSETDYCSAEGVTECLRCSSVLCLEPWNAGPSHELCLLERRDDDILGLLQTCRRIYREAIGILYSGNAFHFQDSDTFIAFSMTIPRIRLERIRQIIIEFTTSFYNGRNPVICDVIRYYSGVYVDILLGFQNLEKVVLIFNAGSSHCERVLVTEAALNRAFETVESYHRDGGSKMPSFYFYIDPKIQDPCGLHHNGYHPRLTMSKRWPIGRLIGFNDLLPA